MTILSKQQLEAPSGFEDLDPRKAIAQNRVIDVIRRHYELAGFVPIQTPLVERESVLSAKAEGEIRQQVYGLRLLNPASNATDDTKDLALRFDQTVPLARFVGRNYRELQFPFRRYVIGPVFRGEKPKKGRFRQFIQADIDAIGDGELDLLHDADVVAVIVGIFTELAFGDFTVRIGNRKVLQGLLRSLGLMTDEKVLHAQRAVDNLAKVGFAEVTDTLTSLGASESAVREFLRVCTSDRSTDTTLADLLSLNYGELFTAGVDELATVIDGVRQLGVSENRFRIDVSIARGLDYYTGTVYETRLDRYPDLGSIAGGGRYDEIIGSFVGKNFPGVGISIGVTRLCQRLIEAQLLPAVVGTVAPVLVTVASDLPEDRGYYLSIAGALRAAGIGAEVYLSRGRALSKQMQFANRRGFMIAIIARESEVQSKTLVVRHLQTGEQREGVAINALVENVRSLL